MSEEGKGKVLRFPRPGEDLLTYHLQFPNLGGIIRAEEDPVLGLSHVAAAMEHMSECFEELSEVFRDCPGAKWESGTHFYEGSLVFVFHIPRRYRIYMEELGYEPSKPSESAD